MERYIRIETAVQVMANDASRSQLSQDVRVQEEIQEEAIRRYIWHEVLELQGCFGAWLLNYLDFDLCSQEE